MHSHCWLQKRTTKSVGQVRVRLNVETVDLLRYRDTQSIQRYHSWQLLAFDRYRMHLSLSRGPCIDGQLLQIHGPEGLRKSVETGADVVLLLTIVPLVIHEGGIRSQAGWKI